jgi:hypothetical protein
MVHTVLISIIHTAGDLMTIKKSILIVLLVFLMISVAFSERVTLTSGEILEGELLSMDQETITFKTMDGNVVSINRTDVAAIDYQKEVYNTTKTGQIPVTAGVQQLQQPVAPIAPMQEVVYPPVAYPIDIYAGSGLLDPELEARKRLVTFNERKKNPFLASSVGLVFPGCGHFYSEKIASGFFFLGSRVLFGTLTWYGFKSEIDPNTSLSVYNDIIVGSIGAVGFSALTIFEVIDAYYSAEEFNDILRLKLGIETVHEEVMPIFGN